MKKFGSLKDLSDHIVRHNHYASSCSVEPKQVQERPPIASPLSSKERKKALPVKKLFEFERSRQEVTGNTAPISAREIMESGKLHCERLFLHSGLFSTLMAVCLLLNKFDFSVLPKLTHWQYS